MGARPEIDRHFATLAEMRTAAAYELTEQTHGRLREARTVLVDLRALATKRTAAGLTAELDEMAACVAKAGAAMSLAQCLDKDLLEPGVRLRGYRPPRYGRAAVFECALPGDGRNWLLDVKGCGVADGVVPQATKNASGLLFLHLALSEVINARLIDALCRRAQVDVACVPIFAVVHLGLSVSSSEGPEFPVANMVRDGHLRPPDNEEICMANSVEEAVKFEVERTLSSYGLTSTGFSNLMCITYENDRLNLRYGAASYQVKEEQIWEFLDGMDLTPPVAIFPTNVQLTDACSIVPLRARLVDLSHYKTFRPSAAFVSTLVSDRLFNINQLRSVGGCSSDAPERSGLNRDLLRERALETDERFEVITKIFPGWKKPKRRISGVMCEALYLAAQTQAGLLTPEAVDQAVDAFVATCMES
jgi:hypothetical protein